MSNFDEFILTINSCDVEYKTLESVCELITDYVAAGSFANLREKVKYLDTPDFAQLVRTTDLKSNFINKNFIYVSESAFEFLWRVNLDKEMLVLPNIGNCGEVYYITPDKLPHPNNVLGPNAILLRTETYNNRFLYYLFQSSEFKKQLYKITSQTGQSSFNKTDLKKIILPIPMLKIQNEIVRILDNFTELAAELTAELTARKKQYEYYLNDFFGKDISEMIEKCSSNSIDIHSLEEIGTFTRGKRFVRDDIQETGVPCIHYGDLYTYYGISAYETKCFLDFELSKKMRFASKGDVVIVQAGENDMDIGIGVAWLGDPDVAIHDACYIYKHNINPKYISYYLRSNVYHMQIKKYVSIGKICSVSSQGIGKALIPVPSLEEQQRIVDILDKFDKLVNDISEGLPAEIATRQKQYEYYRDKLLTFKEVGNESI